MIKTQQYMCLYEHNKNMPRFTYLTFVLAPLFETAAKRAVRYVKMVSLKSAQEVQIFMRQG